MIIVVVIVAIAGIFGYLYATKSLPGQKSAAGCSKSTSVTVWQDFSSTEFPAFSKAVAQFEAANPGDTVSYVNDSSPSPSNYVAAALSCTAPDVLIGASDFAGGLYYDGFLANLKDYLPSSAFAPFITAAISDDTQSGAVYGIPLNVNGVAMIYNKELIPTAPQTTNEMIQDAKNVTVISSSGKFTTAGLIYGVDADGGYRYPAWLTGFGGQLFQSNGAPNLNTSAAVNALTFANNFSTVDKIEPPGVTAESTYEDLFAEGHVGIIFDGPWDIDMYINALPGEVGVAPMPIVSQTGLHPLPLWGSIGAYISTRNSSGASSALFNESIKFAQFLASPTVEGELFNTSGDIPSISTTFKYVESLNIPFVNGFLDQFFNYSQPFPNTVSMTYYWDPYATEISDYVAGSISASAAMAGIQASMISQMTQNKVPPY